KQRREVRGAERFTGSGMERRRKRRGQIRLDVGPMRRQVLFVELKLALLRRRSFRSRDSHTELPQLSRIRQPAEPTPLLPARVPGPQCGASCVEWQRTLVFCVDVDNEPSAP